MAEQALRQRHQQPMALKLVLVVTVLKLLLGGIVVLVLRLQPLHSLQTLVLALGNVWPSVRTNSTSCRQVQRLKRQHQVLSTVVVIAAAAAISLQDIASVVNIS